MNAGIIFVSGFPSKLISSFGPGTFEKTMLPLANTSTAVCCCKNRGNFGENVFTNHRETMASVVFLMTSKFALFYLSLFCTSGVLTSMSTGTSVKLFVNMSPLSWPSG